MGQNSDVWQAADAFLKTYLLQLLTLTGGLVEVALYGCFFQFSIRCTYTTKKFRKCLFCTASQRTAKRLIFITDEQM